MGRDIYMLVPTFAESKVKRTRRPATHVSASHVRINFGDARLIFSYSFESERKWANVDTLIMGNLLWVWFNDAKSPDGEEHGWHWRKDKASSTLRTQRNRKQCNMLKGAFNVEDEYSIDIELKRASEQPTEGVLYIAVINKTTLF